MRLARRAFLASCLVCTSLGVGLLLYAGEGPSDLPSRHALFGSRTDPTTTESIPQAPAPSLAADQPRLSFFALGDTGLQTPAKSEVATAMALLTKDARPEFVMLLGDNFYPSGVLSIDDSAWTTHFEDAYGQKELRIPFYAALGNHDHDGNTQAQVEYGLSGKRWRMPASYYSFSHHVTAACEVQFFVLDTTPLRLGDHVADEQIRWLEDKLARSTAHWKIVVGHHPVVSGGHHGGSSRVRGLVEPLFDRYGVDLYLSGHDHDLQLLKPAGGYLQIVSGSGSSTRDVHQRKETLFAEAEPGFVWVLVSETGVWIQFVTASEGPRFTYQVPQQS